MRSFDFTGRRVLVTGASHGIGFAVARAFAAAGAELAILPAPPTSTTRGRGSRRRAAARSRPWSATSLIAIRSGAPLAASAGWTCS